MGQMNDIVEKKDVNDIELKLKEFFSLCESASNTLKSVDMASKYEVLSNVQKKSKEIFQLLENYVNPFGVKDFKCVTEDEKVLVKLHFMIMRILYILREKGCASYLDARCAGSSDLAFCLMNRDKFFYNFGSIGTWYTNDTLYLQGIIPGIIQTQNSMIAPNFVHPTLMQNIVRFLVNTILAPEYRNQQIYNYMKEYLLRVKYYLSDAPSEMRVYLDFI